MKLQIHMICYITQMMNVKSSTKISHLLNYKLSRTQSNKAWITLDSSFMFGTQKNNKEYISGTCDFLVVKYCSLDLKQQSSKQMHKIFNNMSETASSREMSSTSSSVLASPFLQGAVPALVRVTPCPFSLFVAAPCPLWLTWMSFSIPVTSS